MINLQNIEKILARIEELLRLGASSNWVKTIENSRKELLGNPTSTVSNILGMYGGMGSFNDIVLYKNGQPLISENIEFDELREQLYELCKQS